MMKKIFIAVMIVLMATFVGSAMGADTSDPSADIKANGSDGPIVVSSSDTVSIEISLSPGWRNGTKANWWIGAQTPWDPPLHFYSYVFSEGWQPDIRRSYSGDLYEIDSWNILNIPLEIGQYVFYAGISDPDGVPFGVWWAKDSVEVSVVDESLKHTKASDNLKKYLSADDFTLCFPYANGGKGFSIADADDELYSYENLLGAVDLKEEFAVFLSQGDDTTKKLELAAILANWAQETTGGWNSRDCVYTDWGLYFYEETNVRGKASCDYCYYDANSEYQPTTEPSCQAGVGNGCFFGRGPIQLSWNSNYGPFSEFMYNDKMMLLNDPDAILKDGKLAFASGFWFWTMYNDSPNINDKTCHEVMVEHGAKGFGRTLNIINGGIECGHKLPVMEIDSGSGLYKVDKTRRRADHFHRFADILGVGDQLPTRPEGYATNDEEWNTYYEEMLEGCIECSTAQLENLQSTSDFQ